jgi:hypothetical protein
MNCLRGKSKRWRTTQSVGGWHSHAERGHENPRDSRRREPRLGRSQAGAWERAEASQKLVERIDRAIQTAKKKKTELGSGGEGTSRERCLLRAKVASNHWLPSSWLERSRVLGVGVPTQSDAERGNEIRIHVENAKRYYAAEAMKHQVTTSFRAACGRAL